MTLIIDTGDTYRPEYRINRVEGISDAIIDSLPPTATQAQVDDATAQIVTGELRQPKQLKTVRRRLCQLWPLIEPLAEREPDMFDAILLEFSDRATSLG